MAMAKERQTPQYLCEFWNCHEGGDMPAPFTVSVPGDPGERKRFCSAAHAALWLILRELPPSISTPDGRKYVAGFIVDTMQNNDIEVKPFK